MALVWVATISVRDAKGQIANQKMHIESQDLIAIAEESDDPVDFLTEFALMQDGLIDGAIVGLKLTIDVQLPDGIKTNPLAIADVENAVTYSLRASDGAPVIVRIPTFSESLLTTEGTVISTTETEDFALMMTAPEELPADWGIGLSDNRGTPVNRLAGARETFKRSRRD